MNWMLRRLLTIFKNEIDRRTDEVRLAIGRSESRYARSAACGGLRDAEFRVFSQWGDDGIIQYLLGRVPVPHPVFVEFGVEDYSESNTRFLLCNDNWRGVIIDAGTAHQRFVAERGLDWRHDVTAVSSFITQDNIDALIRGAGVEGDIGLLSIDIDGNDYWILQAISCVSPRILVVEYNAMFGDELAVTVPYRPDFQRDRAHHSRVYYGASLSALALLAERKGYQLVGCNGAGNNAYFVRRDVLGAIQPLSVRDAFVMNRFRESRDTDGRLTFVRDAKARRALVGELEVFDVTSGRTRSIRDAYQEAP